ncbi:hypothetical protein CI109_100070 [Kwoniella shandongensis]|uniref:Uncharacterized protein n=1 Tax=Kwoniella shandongensis TaxID=1734106 RepID=A0A5M6BXB0_9TREE|nr:uncharacterized protein CI109_005957 [Kwoniella shandongensis]KAA5525649.1 hypothetical protein CI109_005957 [Kwoniella shandongensis]
MFTKITTTLFALVSLATLSSATITPTSPDGATVVKVGQEINALWTTDSTDGWNNVEIQLMTGDNFNMVPLATVASGIDGTTATSYSFVAPDVTPYSKIYFLQFSNAGNATALTWTTRFTIAGADGSTTEPTNSTVYSGTNVQWGTGTLLSAVSNSTTSSSSNSSSSATSPSAAASSQVSSAVASASDSATASSPASASASGSSAAAVSAASSTAAAAAASTTAAKSAAGRVEFGLGSTVVVGMMAVAALL